MKQCNIFGSSRLLKGIFSNLLRLWVWFGIFVGISFFQIDPVWSAPCCARNSATPALIVGDDQAQVNVGFALANVVANANEFGELSFGSRHESDLIMTRRVDAAFLLSDRVQVGGTLSLVNRMIFRENVSESSLDIGDIRLNIGYEILPLWNYSVWKPQIFLFTSVTLPTGRALYESDTRLLSDVTGNGFYSVSVGSLILKRWKTWDAFLLPEVHYGFSRTFRDLTVMPGFGGSLGLGIGWSPGGGDFRVGMRVHPRLDQSTRTIVSGRISQLNGFISVCDTGLDASYLLSSADSLMVSYTDQTLFGLSTNINVNRSFIINFQHRWER